MMRAVFTQDRGYFYRLLLTGALFHCAGSRAHQTWASHALFCMQSVAGTAFAWKVAAEVAGEAWEPLKPEFDQLVAASKQQGKTPREVLEDGSQS